MKFHHAELIFVASAWWELVPMFLVRSARQVFAMFRARWSRALRGTVRADPSSSSSSLSSTSVGCGRAFELVARFVVVTLRPSADASLDRFRAWAFRSSCRSPNCRAFTSSLKPVKATSSSAGFSTHELRFLCLKR